jgi:hypothetical protein
MTTPEIQATTEEIVEAFAMIARPIIRHASNDWDSCIVATRIAVDVFHHFGLRARALVTRKQIFNAAALEPTCGSVTVSDDTAPEACIVLIGYDNAVSHGNFSGHLVAVVEGEILVDAVADRANLPNTGIELPGVLLHTVDPDFLAGHSLLYGSHSGCTVAYEASPNERSYASTPDWRRVPNAQGEVRSRVAVRTIVAEMSDLIAAPEHAKQRVAMR